MTGERRSAGSRGLFRVLVLLIATAAGLFVVGLVLGLIVVGRHGGGPIQGWDNRVQGWDTHHHLELIGASKVVAFLGDAPKLGVIVVILTIILLVVTRSVRGLVPLVAYLGGEFLVFVIRVIVHRPRPPTANYPAPGSIPGVHETSFSFPSGHSVAVTAVLFGLAGLVALARRWWWPWIIAGVASLFVIDTRLVLEVHWFSDVVFGFVIGAAWGTAVAIVFLPMTWDDLIPSRWAPAGREGGDQLAAPANANARGREAPPSGLAGQTQRGGTSSP